MKINYTQPNGNRSSITLSDKLLDVWALTFEDSDKSFESELIDRVLPEAMKGRRSPGVTLVSMVEFLLLDDIAQAIQFDYLRRGESK